MPAKPVDKKYIGQYPRTLISYKKGAGIKQMMNVL
jgi:hypothetical protein